MILKRKEFSNKEQKRLRRKYDYLQGLKHGYIDVGAGGERKLKDAQSQAKMIGEEKTNELLDYATKHTKSSRNIFGKTVGIPISDKKEFDKIIRAEDLIRAGRQGSRDEAAYPRLTGHKYDTPNHVINRKVSGEFDNGFKLGGEPIMFIKDALKNGSRAHKESIAKHQEQADKLRSNKLYMKTRNAKKWVKKNPGKAAAGLALGTAAVAGTGVGIKKAIDKKKNKEDKN